MIASISLKMILRSARGQSLVEMTLITPLLLLLVLGAVEVSTVISTYLTLTHATREGANLASRGTSPDVALAAIIAGAAPTIRDGNIGQWKIIYSKIRQQPGTFCDPPKEECVYVVESQATRGGFGEESKLGSKGQVVHLPGIENVQGNQMFHAVEVYYDYRPDVMTFIGNNIDQIFYDRTIFTHVSGIS